MKSTIREMIRFAWKRDSESAAGLVIVLAGYMTRRHLSECAAYLQVFRDYGPVKEGD